MKKLVSAISGGSLLISGAIILHFVFSGLDWLRIGDYGLFNELGNGGILVFVFIIGVALLIIGLFLALYSAFGEEEEESKK